MTDTSAAAAAAASTEGTPPEGQEQEAGKTFTQADLDRIVAERLARESKKYADYDDLKAKAEEAARLQAEQEEATASDLDKAVKAARKEVEEALRAEFAQERVADKIDALAAGKFADPEDARLRLASRVGEFVQDGSVDTDAISKALDEVLEKHPHLAAKPEKTPPPAPERAGIGVSGDGKGKPQVSPGLDRLRAAYADKG
jgi:hypothetical protein